MFSSLLSSRRFLPVFLCQFFSALNDNFLKNALVMLILFQIGGEAGGALVTIAGAVLIAPFFLLSALGGELADKHDKAEMAQRLKLAEIPVSAIAALGFVLHSVPLMFLALGLFGVIAALFGPIKYGILPDHLAANELPAGNALVEGATFLAILIGMIAGNMAFEAGTSALGEEHKRMLEMTWTSWILIQQNPGNEAQQLIYFTGMVSWRCGIGKAMYGFNGEGLNTELKFPPCEEKDPMAIPPDFMPFMESPPGLQTMQVQVTYKDGTQSAVREYKPQ